MYNRVCSFFFFCPQWVCSSAGGDFQYNRRLMKLARYPLLLLQPSPVYIAGFLQSVNIKPHTAFIPLPHPGHSSWTRPTAMTAAAERTPSCLDHDNQNPPVRVCFPTIKYLFTAAATFLLSLKRRFISRLWREAGWSEGGADIWSDMQTTAGLTTRVKLSWTHLSPPVSENLTRCLSVFIFLEK